MGVRQDRDSRIPSVERRGDKTILRFSPPGTAEGRALVTHTKGSTRVIIEVDEHAVRLPVAWVRWLAEVLLRVSDEYPVEGEPGVLENYIRDDDPRESR